MLFSCIKLSMYFLIKLVIMVLKIQYVYNTKYTIQYIYNTKYTTLNYFPNQ
jgi:hypothetical protein